MYPVSATYKDKIKELDRTFEAKIQIQHSQGVLDLTDADIVAGSLIYNESSQTGEDFTIGSTVASDLTVEILNKPEYAGYDFVGATITASIGLDVGTAFEYVPLGVFNIDEVGKQRNTTKIKAIDNMIKLDKPYSLSNLVYPATLLQIYLDACDVCDITPAMGSFTNSNYIVQERPAAELTFRDIIGYIAELAGSFARMNRAGALEFVWYADSGVTLTGANRFSFIPRDDLVQIKGVMAVVNGTTYLAGTDEYVVDLTENPLLQDEHETILPGIYNGIKGTSFYPFESSWQGNPAIQAGDVIIQIDRDGKTWPTLVTSSTYKYRGASTLTAKGLPVIAKGFKGSTNRKLTSIKRKIDKEVGDQITNLEQAQLHATQLIANMLGGHAIKADDTFYVADNPDLNLAQEVWKWGIGGFGYSSTGKDGPYTTAVTADGSIVAMLVAANIITADMVRAGELRSMDGSTWISLDDGSFNFKGALKWENDALWITSPDLASKVDKDYFDDTFSDGKITIIEANSLKVTFENITNEALDVIAIADGIQTIWSDLVWTTWDEVGTLTWDELLSLAKVDSSDCASALNALQTEMDKWIDQVEYPLTITLSDRVNITTRFQALKSEIVKLSNRIELRRKEQAEGYADLIDSTSVKKDTKYNNVEISPARGIVATHGDGSETIMDGDGFKRRIVSNGNVYEYLSLSTADIVQLSGRHVVNWAVGAQPKTPEWLDENGIGCEWVTIPNVDFSGREFVVIPSIAGYPAIQTSYGGGAVEGYLNIDIQILEYDYPNRRFKIRGRVESYLDSFDTSRVRYEYVGCKVSYYAYALT